MFCKNCGAKLSEGAVFCEDCGARVLKTQVPPAPQQYAPPQVFTSPQPHTPPQTYAPPQGYTPPQAYAPPQGYPQPLPYSQPPMPQPGGTAAAARGKPNVMIIAIAAVLVAGALIALWFFVLRQKPDGNTQGGADSTTTGQVGAVNTSPVPQPTATGSGAIDGLIVPRPTKPTGANSSQDVFDPTAAPALLTEDYLRGVWITECLPDGFYGALEFVGYEWMDFAILFPFDGNNVPDMADLRAYWRAGDWWYEGMSGGLYQLEGENLTLATGEYTTEHMISVVDENTIFFDGGLMYRISNDPVAWEYANVFY